MNQNYRALHTEANIDKENAFISSNLSLERRYSATRKYRKTNELLLKPALTQYGQEPLALQNANLPARGLKEAEVTRKLNADKVKKTLTFERSSYNGRPGSTLFINKDRFSALEKENKNTLVERGERYSLGESSKPSLMETKKNLAMEPVRTSYAEKEALKLHTAFEPIARENKQEEEVIPEKPSTFVEPEPEKIIPAVVDVKEQCNKTIEEYVTDIMESLKEKDRESTPVYCLKKHKIPANLRAKMIDWMVEVLSSYKCSDQAFFIAVNIMDLYFQKTKIAHEVSDLHLVGVTCMFMASKYEEIYPLRLSVVHEKIAHKKLSPDQIKKKEMEIFATLDYKMTNPTPYEFIMNALYQLDLKDTMAPKLYDYLQKVCIYLAKATMHDYELVSQQDYSELAASTLFVAFKIIEQLDKTFPLAQMLVKLREILQVEEDIVYDCATRILSVAKNFDKLYPNLENLKKFHSFNFDDMGNSSQGSLGKSRSASNY